MDRRTFVTWVGMGWLASCLPVALAACSSTTEDGFHIVGSTADLDQKGQLTYRRFGAETVVVVRDPNQSETLFAVTPKCTHQGCDLQWQSDQKAFVCPCHGARFNADGKVAKGPAGEALKTHPVRIQDDSVQVKV
jgi:cytochrome b6-f complex iron-sulfur subunit